MTPETRYSVKRPARSAPAAPPLKSSGADRVRLAAAALLAVGVGLRLIQYAANRSLWLDEAFLAPAVLDRSYAELLNPGTWMATPPGFLFFSKLSTDLLGPSEYALRLLPFLAGIAAIFLFLAVARELLSPVAALWAFALFALSPYLIYYASEFKPYSSDAAITLALVWLGLHLRKRGTTAASALAFGVAGVAAAAFSLPSVFVSGGVLLTLLVIGARRNRWGEVRLLAGVAAAWAVIFGVPYILFLRRVAEGGYAQSFWQSGFMPFPPRSFAELGWFPHTLVRTFEEPLGVLDDAQSFVTRLQALGGIIVFLVGGVWLGLRRRWIALLLLTPITLALLGSGLRQYPFGGDWSTGGRVLLFLAPLFYLTMGCGIEWLVRGGRRLRIVGIAVAALVLVPLAMQAAIAFPFGRAEIKPILGYVAENWQPGDFLYVHYDAKHPFRFYADRFEWTMAEYEVGVCARYEPIRYLEALSELRGRPRAWVLFGGGVGAHRFPEQELMLDYLDHVGTRLDDRVALGSAVFLYDLDPPVNTPFPHRIPDLPYTVEEDCGLWR